MKVYISIPITGHDYETQKAKAEKYARHIYELGHTPVNPFNTEAPEFIIETATQKESNAYFMGEDIKALLNSDAIYLAKGWEDSKGCNLENAAAKIYGLNVYTRLDQIPEPE